MNARSLIPAIFMMAVGTLLADPKPAFVVQVVQTDDSDAYVGAITKVNALIKARTGIEKLRHVWMGELAGENSHGIFVVSEFPSAAALDAYMGDPRRTALAADRDRAVARTEIIEVELVPHPD